MIKYFYLLCFLLAFNHTKAQELNDNPFELAASLVEKNQYQKATDTLRKLLKQYNRIHHVAAGAPNTSVLDQALATYQSFIGEAYPIRWKAHPPKRNYAAGSTRFEAAIPYIAGQAASRQVVMVNEDHNQPKHRLLTYNLLDTLYAEGFRYLAVETIDPEDSSIRQYGYPKMSSGTYSVEPNMANLIRKAVSLGYHVIGYESQDTTENNEKQQYYADNLRELNQARNLYQILIKDPKAKIIVHAGHGHVWEKTDNELILMGEYFKIMSGIDPLTINQSVNKADEFETALKEQMGTRLSPMPYVVLDSRHRPRTSAYDSPDSYDLLVSWPKAKLDLGRWDYLAFKRGAKPYPISVEERDAGKLLQIKSLDRNDEIPVDQFLIKPLTKRYQSYLEKGKYLMQLVDLNGKALWQKEIVVD
ncbi:hypothetical protein [Pedobacter aquatilis]|uniref:hypothetical protein n=1 Tax=Pedobacter aquatilis TaxID=351343 RepID=UPI0029316728|nr:hypothetical protein [Pedobacter aquatilis]